MSAFDRYFHGSYYAARAYVFAKMFLVVVAIDAFLLMIGHAGRYGEAGFNVAHFAWLDALQPLPTSGLYIGVLLASGLLALTLAFGRAHALGHLALFLLYTYSWSMSMLDSYQHHYFVSCVLLCMVFFPKLTGEELFPAPKTAEPAATLSAKEKKKLRKQARKVRKLEAASRMAHAFGYPLLAVNIAILYTYTAIAKLDAAWLDGHTLRRISSAERVFAPLVSFASSFGISTDLFFSLVATSVVPVELFIALSYALAVRRDQSTSIALTRAVTLGFVLAMTLHVGAEALALEIGWFSYYMMLFACVYLLPGSWVEQLARVISFPGRQLSRALGDARGESQAAQRMQLLLLTLASAGLLWIVGRILDLPGAMTACLVAAACLFALTLGLLVRKAHEQARSLLVGAALATLVMTLAVTQSEVRWDFYRFLGGDLARRGHDEAALDAYLKGERYAPAGQSRQDKIDALRQKLGR